MHVILDIDGTIADNTHRAHHLKSAQGLPPDWDAFLAHDLVRKDLPLREAQRVVAKFQALKYHLVFLTGRIESLRDVTSTWLLQHFDFQSDDYNLLMRPVSNMLTNAQYKAQQMQTLLAEYKAAGANDFIFIEDDSRVFEAYAAEGLVLQAPQCWPSMFPTHVEPETE